MGTEPVSSYLKLQQGIYQACHVCLSIWALCVSVCAQTHTFTLLSHVWLFFCICNPIFRALQSKSKDLQSILHADFFYKGCISKSFHGINDLWWSTADQLIAIYSHRKRERDRERKRDRERERERKRVCVCVGGAVCLLWFSSCLVRERSKIISLKFCLPWTPHPPSSLNYHFRVPLSLIITLAVLRFDTLLWVY